MMKRALSFTFILAFLPFAAKGASKNSAYVVLDNTVSVGTTEVPKGTYKIVWAGTDANGQVTFTNGNGARLYRRTEARNDMEAQTTAVKDNKTFLTALELHDATLVFADGTHSGE